MKISIIFFCFIISQIYSLPLYLNQDIEYDNNNNNKINQFYNFKDKNKCTNFINEYVNNIHKNYLMCQDVITFCNHNILDYRCTYIYDSFICNQIINNFEKLNNTKNINYLCNYVK